MNYVVLPLFLFTFLLHCHLQKPLVSVLLSPENPPTLLEADGILKLLSKMHASLALLSPLSSFATCSLRSVSIYAKLLLLFHPHSLCRLCSLSPPPHIGTYSRKANQGQAAARFGELVRHRSPPLSSTGFIYMGKIC